jgi:hypothetical protein
VNRRSRAPVRHARALALIAMVVLGGTLLPQAGRPPIALASYPSCNSTDGHYRAKAVSGTSSNGGDIGTGVATTSWTNWSVYTKNGNAGFSNIAAWMIDLSDGSSIEAGFYTGYGYNWPFNNGMLPYYTTSNGEFAYREAGDYIPANVSVWMAGTTTYNGATARAYVYNQYFNLSTYHVNLPRTNASQAEVDASGHS